MKKLKLVFALITLIHAEENLQVEIPDGKIKGTTFTSFNGRSFFTWRHIPFAKPPLGELRFKPPVKPDPWTNTLDGSKDSSACLSAEHYEGDPIPSYGYSEDCLYVNVYSPVGANSSINLLPVMFWIYGGGFVMGSGDFSFTDPTPFLEENVIVVTFNYRLDIFGFLTLEDEILPGNAGLKDQLAALAWTKENIVYFGGNPNKITIFGESAGAMSVGYHIISPLSKNLFVGGIMESGSALLDLSMNNTRTSAILIANQINSTIAEESSSEEILKVLRNADANDLLYLSFAARNNNIYFFPILEVELNNSQPFLTKPFLEQLEDGNFNKIPVIIGTNNEEAISIVSTLNDAEALANYYDSNLQLLIPRNFKLNKNSTADQVNDEIKNAYLGNALFRDDLSAAIRFESDNFMVRSSIKHAVLQSAFTSVYYYLFSFVGTESLNHPDIAGCGRVGHAEEVPYLFNVSTKIIKTDADFLMRKRFVKLWTNFAKFQNPTPNDESVGLLENIVWDKFDKENLQYLDIGENLEIKYQREAELVKFWDYIWDTYSYRPYNTF